jgi:hypothetical protein
VPDLRGYDLAVQRELLPDIVASRGLMEVFHAWPAPAVLMATRSGRLWRQFCDLLRGEETYDSIVRSTGPFAPTLGPLASLARRITIARYGAR